MGRNDGMNHFSHPEGASDAREAFPAIDSLETENTTYSGIGAELYAARLRAGLELSDVSQRLRIRLQHLESIERGAFDEIPGRIYAIGFLRTYAEFLGFDGDDIVNRFKAETGGGAAPAKLVFPSPAPESRMPGATIIIAALVLAAVAYGAWYYMHDIQRIATELVSEVPPRLQTEETARDTASTAATDSSSGEETAEDEETAEQPAAATPESSETPAAETNPVETQETQTASAEPVVPVETEPAPQAAPEPEPVETAAAVEPTEPAATPQPAPADDQPAEAETTGQVASLPPPAAPAVTGVEPNIEPAQTAESAAESATEPTPALTSSPPPPPPPPAAPPSEPLNDAYAPQQYGISNTDARVVLRARYDCWVQVRGANDEQFLTKVLRAGDTYHVPNRADIRLYASDAGALEVLVDGQSIPPIGGPGEIVRDVPLEASSLLNRG